jgi:hypothetical protein
MPVHSFPEKAIIPSLFPIDRVAAIADVTGIESIIAPLGLSSPAQAAFAPTDSDHRQQSLRHMPQLSD